MTNSIDSPLPTDPGYRILIMRELGPECPADPECYFASTEETVQLLDQVLDSEARWPHLSELRVIEVTRITAVNDSHPTHPFRTRPSLPLDQGELF